MELHTAKGSWEIDDEHILTNDVVFPWEYDPFRVRLWVIGNEFGPIVALWAGTEQDAFDETLDRGYEHFLVQPEDVDPKLDEGGFYAHLGNAGEPCDLSYAWIEAVQLEPVRDLRLIVKLAEARGAGADNLQGV